jgi:hypothetical protein
VLTFAENLERINREHEENVQKALRKRLKKSMPLVVAMIRNIVFRLLLTIINWSFAFLCFCQKPRKVPAFFRILKEKMLSVKHGVQASWRAFFDVISISIEDPKALRKAEVPDVFIVGLIMELYADWTPLDDFLDEIEDYWDTLEHHTVDFSEPYDPRLNIEGIKYVAKETWSFSKEVFRIYKQTNMDYIKLRVELWVSRWRTFLNWIDYKGRLRVLIAPLRHYLYFFVKNPWRFVVNLLWYWPYYIYMVFVRYHFPLSASQREYELGVFVRTFPSAEQKIATTMKFAYCYFLMKRFRQQELREPILFPEDEAEVRQRIQSDPFFSRSDEEIWDALFGPGLGSVFRYMSFALQESKKKQT